MNRKKKSRYHQDQKYIISNKRLIAEGPKKRDIGVEMRSLLSLKRLPDGRKLVAVEKETAQRSLVGQNKLLHLFKKAGLRVPFVKLDLRKNQIENMEEALQKEVERWENKKKKFQRKLEVETDPEKISLLGKKIIMIDMMSIPNIKSIQKKPPSKWLIMDDLSEKGKVYNSVINLKLKVGWGKIENKQEIFKELIQNRLKAAELGYILLGNAEVYVKKENKITPYLIDVGADTTNIVSYDHFEKKMFINEESYKHGIKEFENGAKIMGITKSEIVKAKEKLYNKYQEVIEKLKKNRKM